MKEGDITTELVARRLLDGTRDFDEEGLPRLARLRPRSASWIPSKDFFSKQLVSVLRDGNVFEASRLSLQMKSSIALATSAGRTDVEVSALLLEKSLGTVRRALLQTLDSFDEIRTAFFKTLLRNSASEDFKLVHDLIFLERAGYVISYLCRDRKFESVSTFVQSSRRLFKSIELNKKIFTLLEPLHCRICSKQISISYFLEHSQVCYTYEKHSSTLIELNSEIRTLCALVNEDANKIDVTKLPKDLETLAQKISIDYKDILRNGRLDLRVASRDDLSRTPLDVFPSLRPLKSPTSRAPAPKLPLKEYNTIIEKNESQVSSRHGAASAIKVKKCSISRSSSGSRRSGARGAGGSLRGAGVRLESEEKGRSEEVLIKSGLGGPAGRSQSPGEVLGDAFGDSSDESVKEPRKEEVIGRRVLPGGMFVAKEKTSIEEGTEEECYGDNFGSFSSGSDAELSLTPETNRPTGETLGKAAGAGKFGHFLLQVPAINNSKTFHFKREEPADPPKNLSFLKNIIAKGSVTEYQKKKEPYIPEEYFVLKLRKDLTEYENVLIKEPLEQNYFLDIEFLSRLSVEYPISFSSGFSQRLEALRGLLRRRIAINKELTRARKKISQIDQLASGKSIHRATISRSSCNLPLVPTASRTYGSSSDDQSSTLIHCGQKTPRPSLQPSLSGDSPLLPELRIRKSPSDSQIMQQLMKERLYSQRTSSISYDDFLVGKSLGKGAYGEVFLAIHKHTKDVFAMKVINLKDKLDPKTYQSLFNEINILKMIKGNYLTKAFYSFIHANSLHIIMEYIVGGDFRSRLEEEGRFEIPVARFYAAQLVLAIEEMHEGCIHRDLKPENLLIDSQGHLKLTDFGLSEIHKSSQDCSKLSSSLGQLKGTPDYIPPEILSEVQSIENSPEIQRLGPKEKNGSRSFEELPKSDAFGGVAFFGGVAIPTKPGESKLKISSDRTVDGHFAPHLLNPKRRISEGQRDSLSFTRQRLEAIDWWGVGCLIYEFIVGVSPFSGQTEKEVYENIRCHAIEWPSSESDMPPEARDIIERLLSPTPEKRLGFSGAAEVKAHPFFEGIEWEDLRSQPGIFKPETCPVERAAFRHADKVHDSPVFTNRLANLTMQRPDLLDKSNIDFYHVTKKELLSTLIAWNSERNLREPLQSSF